MAIRRSPQGPERHSANVDGMAPWLAEFEAVDLTVPLVGITVCVAAGLAAWGRRLSNTGRRVGPSVLTTPTRRFGAALRLAAGRAVLVVAAVVLIGGTWIGIRAKSPWQIERDTAAASCAEEYPRFVQWEKAGNSLDNWWTGDPLLPGTVPQRASRKQFIDRCVDMSR